jgi:TonB family protein
LIAVRRLFPALLALSATAGLAGEPGSPAASAPASSPAPAAAAPRPVLRAVPIARQRHPGQPRLFGSKAIDIPQAAKDAGHNGRATWRIAVSADGRATSLDLVRSSNSPAIDEAARARLAGATYLPATDAEGKPVAGTVDVFLDYARWDKDTPGGGIADYRCADLVREHDWFFTAKPAGDTRIFPLENFHDAVVMAPWRLANPGVSREAVAARRQEMKRAWQKVVDGCRRHPDALLLDRVEDPAGFRRWVEAF